MIFGQRETGRDIARAVAVLVAASILWALGGCGSLPGDQSGQSGSQFSVASMTGSYRGKGSNQIDVVQDNCETDPLKLPKWEYYSDHFVDAGFLNRPLPNAEEQTASMITITSAVIRYTPLDTVTSPYPLPSPLVVEIRADNVIPACAVGGSCAATVMSGVYFVPLQTKKVLRGFYDALVASGGQQLAYNVSYEFGGTNDFGEVVTADGQMQFYVSNYDNCGTGG